MIIRKYLIISAQKSRYGGLREKTRLAERVPTLEGNEISLRLELDIPDAVFQRPQLEARMTIPDTAVKDINITPDITDNISQIIKEATGLTMVVSVIKQEEEKEDEKI